MGSVLRTIFTRALFTGSVASLIGCPAEQLGVELPRGGVGALSMEDITRDVMMLSSSRDRLRNIERRLQDMRTLPAFGRSYLRVVDGEEILCGRRDGGLGQHSQEAIVVLALDTAVDDRDGASQVAGLISLAKVFDMHEPPKLSMIFCVTSEEGGTDRYYASPPVPLENTVVLYTLGRFGGSSGSEVTRTEGETPSGGDLVHMQFGVESSPAQLDFHTILNSVSSLHEEIMLLQE